MRELVHNEHQRDVSGCHAPRRRGIQYSLVSEQNYRRRRLLDRPPARTMTKNEKQTRNQSQLSGTAHARGVARAFVFSKARSGAPRAMRVAQLSSAVCAQTMQAAPHLLRRRRDGLRAAALATPEDEAKHAARGVGSAGACCQATGPDGPPAAAARGATEEGLRSGRCGSIAIRPGFPRFGWSSGLPFRSRGKGEFGRRGIKRRINRPNALRGVTFYAMPAPNWARCTRLFVPGA
jgi:hypothetical protein